MSGRASGRTARTGLRPATLTCRYANIPQPLLPQGEGEQDFKVPLPRGEGFRVRADKVDMLPVTGLFDLIDTVRIDQSVVAITDESKAQPLPRLLMIQVVSQVRECTSKPRQ